MARFGSSDAFFGLDGFADETPDASDNHVEEFDLDRDDMNKQFDMSSLDNSLPGNEAPPPGTGGMPPGMPPGFEDLDPSVLQELTGLMAGGMPDPMKLRKLMIQNPSLQKMMEQFAPGMMGMDMPGMGGMGQGGQPGIGGKPPNVRANSQRERLQERLRQKREQGEVNIPEVKASNKSGSSGVSEKIAADDDDWLVSPSVSSSSSSKKKGSKKKGKKR